MTWRQWSISWTLDLIDTCAAVLEMGEEFGLGISPLGALKPGISKPWLSWQWQEGTKGNFHPLLHFEQHRSNWQCMKYRSVGCSCVLRHSRVAAPVAVVVTRIPPSYPSSRTWESFAIFLRPHLFVISPSAIRGHAIYQRFLSVGWVFATCGTTAFSSLLLFQSRES
jgi:hypothetical protein